MRKTPGEGEANKGQDSVPSNLERLQELVSSGQFHHATYRCIGTLWEGLWIYARSESGFRGFEVAGCFRKGDVDLEAAYALVRGTGVSVGAYGRG